MTQYENYRGVSRKTAIATGLRFYEGKPCKVGHLGIRQMNGSCVYCANVASADPERRKVIYAKMKVWRAKKGREYYRQYRANPEKSARMFAAVLKHHYRKNLGENYGPDDDDAVAAMWLKAKELSTRTGERHYVVHLLPIRHGGKHEKDNLAVMSASARRKWSRRVRTENRVRRVMDTLVKLSQDL